MTRDLHVTLAGGLLVALGAPMVLLGLLLIGGGLAIGASEPEFRAHPNGLWLGLAIGVMECVLIAGMGATSAVAGIGVLLGRRWGWALAVALAALTAPGGCLPVSGYVLYALLRDPARRAFGIR